VEAFTTLEQMATATVVSLTLAALLLAYFIGGLLLYLVRRSIRGRFRDAELEGRSTTLILGIEIRLYFAWITRPVFAFFAVTGLPADAVTLLSLLLALGAGFALAAGVVGLGAWLFIGALTLDFLDGRLARMTGQSSPAGALLDSTLDRYGEAAVFVGLAWFYRDSWVAAAALAALVGSMLVSYVRARSEGLGVDATVGLMQRPERGAILGVAFGVSPFLDGVLPGPPHVVIVGALILLAVGTNITAVRRLAFGHARLGGTMFNGWAGGGRGSLARNAVSSGLATVADFTMVSLLVTAISLEPVLATVLGCALGAVTNFSINRAWVFQSRQHPMLRAGRYGLVSLFSAGLNTGGVALILLLPDTDYRIAWIVARLLVYLAWNYPMQRAYVFSEVASPAIQDRQPCTMEPGIAE